MASRARDRLRLLEPCLAVREAQLQAVKSDALAARRELDAAESKLREASSRQSGVTSAWARRAGHSASLGVDELRMWRIAAASAHQSVESKRQQLHNAEGEFALHADKVARADGARKVLDAAVGRARKRSTRDVQEKSAAVFEDLLAGRRPKR